MMRRGAAIGLGSVSLSALALSAALASPCRQEIAACARTECAERRGQERRFCLATCGGRVGCPLGGPAPIRTLAYVVTECRDGPEGFSARQVLRIRRGDHEPITVAESPAFGPVDLSSLADAFEEGLGYRTLCEAYGAYRFGLASVFFGVFHRLRVSPDGSAVVFEVTDDHMFLPPVSGGVLAPEREGIFFVRSDGTGLRRLDPASREPSFLFEFGGGALVALVYAPHELRFSPDGRRIVYTDRGPGPGGEEVTQVFTLEVEGGKPARQVTRLPTGPPWGGGGTRTVGPPWFVDNETIAFGTTAELNGETPEGIPVGVTVRVDGTGLRVFPLTATSAAGSVVPIFAVTGARPNVTTLNPPGPALNSSQPAPIREVFLVDGTRLLQLTNFRRFDTGIYPTMRPGGQRVFFPASADPFGTNPGQECQLFSISRFGTHLRQLTFFRTVDRAVTGCFPAPESRECVIGGMSAQDPRTGTLVYGSTCDPFGTNPNGEQIFALRPDSSGLRQLTFTRGLVRSPSGIVETELPGPAAYSGGQVP